MTSAVTPQFDVDSARKAGYSDDEILQHLTASRNFDIQGAVKSGYSKQDIINHLSSSPAPSFDPEKMKSDLAAVQDTGVLGGMGNRLMEMGKGVLGLFKPPETTAEKVSLLAGPAGPLLMRLGIGGANAIKQSAPQVVDQLNAANQIPEGNAAIKALSYTRAGNTALSMFNPLATGAVSNVNQLQDQGKPAQAAGSGIMDSLALLLGMKGTKSTALDSGNLANDLRPALKPKDLQFGQNVKTAFPAIQDQIATTGNPTSVNSLISTIKAAKMSTWDKFTNKLTQAQGSGAMIDGNNIAQSQLNSLPDAITGQIDPGIEKAITNTFDAYAGKKFTPQQIEARIEAINNDLGSKYAQMGKGVDYSAVARDPYIAPRLAEADALRQELYDTIDKNSASPADAAQLKKQYGAMTSIQNIALRAQMRLSSRAPFSLSDTLNLPGAAADFLMGHPLSAIGRTAVNAMLKRANTPDALVSKAFSPGPGIISSTVKGAGITSGVMQKNQLNQVLSDALSKANALPPEEQ